MMNYLFIAGFIVTFLLSPDVDAQKRFEISGIIPIRYNGVQIELSSDDSTFNSIKTKVINGAFHFSGRITQKFERVSLTASRNDEHLTGWNFFIGSGKMKIEILNLDGKANQNNIRYVGVPFVKEQEMYNALLTPVQESLRHTFSLLRDVNIGYRKGFNADSLETVVSLLQAEERARKIEFVKDLTHTYLALHIFDKQVVDYFSISSDSLMAIYCAFDQSLKETELGKSIHARISKRQSLSINRMLPDFAFSTNAGQLYTLSSFRKKKYVLLCFWDSYCAPCIKSIPLLKQLNEVYADRGLQMVSVSIDKSFEKWMTSLGRLALPWLQTCDLPAYIKGPAVQSLYDIDYIPQYFLIDKEGILIYHNTQLKDDDDYGILQEMLKNILN